MSALSEFQEQFQPVLQRTIETLVQRTSVRISQPILQNALQHLPTMILSGGKRVRPYVADVMYRAVGGTQREALWSYVTALEIFHVFGLIHDDIIDRGTERHGVPTIHRQMASFLQQEHRVGDLLRVSENQAMLIGDLVFGWVCQHIATAGHFVEPSRVQEAQDRFYAMVDEVVLGQLLDVDLTTCTQAEDAWIEEKMRLKTASYTFIRPMQIGSVLGGGTAADEQFCAVFGENLGLAFQIQDDVLDVLGSPKQIGKSAMRDLAERQQTVLTQWVFRHGSLEQRKVLRQAMGRELTSAEQEEIRAIFEQSGALAQARSQMEGYFVHAKDAVQGSLYTAEIRQELLDLVALIQNRTS